MLLAVIDNYSRFTWIMFLVNKCECLKHLLTFSKWVENEKDHCIKVTKLKDGGELKYVIFDLILFWKNKFVWVFFS